MRPRMEPPNIKLLRPSKTSSIKHWLFTITNQPSINRFFIYWCIPCLIGIFLSWKSIKHHQTNFAYWPMGLYASRVQLLSLLRCLRKGFSWRPGAMPLRNQPWSFRTVLWSGCWTMGKWPGTDWPLTFEQRGAMCPRKENVDSLAMSISKQRSSLECQVRCSHNYKLDCLFSCLDEQLSELELGKNLNQLNLAMLR